MDIERGKPPPMPSKTNSTAPDTREAAGSRRSNGSTPEPRPQPARPSPAPRPPRGASAIPAPSKAELGLHRVPYAARPLPTREQIAARAQLHSRIDNLVASAQRRAAAQLGGVAPGMGNGMLDWPTVGTITQEYGCTGYWVNPPRGDCPHHHDGIDIANGAGTPIRAAGAGVVAFIGYNPWESVPSFIVVIAHGGGISSLYAHMQPSYPVSQGQFVKKGQIIGSMGSTYDRAGGGYSTGVHLHFTVKVDGSPVDPLQFLP